MTDKQEYNNQINASFEAVQEYMQSLSSLESVPDIINKGLKVLKDFPDTISISLFVLDKQTYEFEHRASIPYVSKDDSIDLFECLVEYGSVGMALETGKVTYYPNSKEATCQENCMIIPLIASGGPIGIIIQSFKKIPTDLEVYRVKIISFFASLFANKLENAFLLSQLRKDHSLLEQKIAARSISLTQNNRELQAILGSVDTGIVVIDITSNRIVNANSSAYRILGINAGDLIDKDSSTFFDFLDTKEVYDDRIKFSRNFEAVIRKPNGERIPILRTFSNVSFGDKKYRIESFYEITEQKRISQELSRSNELLELKVQERTEDLQLLVVKLKEEIDVRKNAETKLSEMLNKEIELHNMKTQFISMISHEFRTPMTLISSAAQMLKKFRAQLAEEDIEKYIERILKSVDNMTGMIENIIFIGKSDSNHLKFNPKPLNISKCAKEIIQESIIISGKNREIDFECNVDTKSIFLDEDLIRQILINLLTNAMKYSPDDSIVELYIHFENDSCVFTVKDYGIGIPNSEQFKIFELFHRGANVGNVSGTGLGLTVVQRALELHSGTLELISKTNQGTTINVKIPTRILNA